MQKQAIFLMGPTAVGKTALAMQIADRLPVDLISVDSAMVYRGMDIGTGKPTIEELKRYPHALIDICDPSVAYSAAQFCLDAKAAMQNSWQAGRIPLLVGGTMLYFKALENGLSELPSADNNLRTKLMEEANSNGWAYMHAKLSQIDKLAAEQLNPNDTQRIIRALEINQLTGKTLQENYNASIATKPDYKIESFAIMPETREQLHINIAKRFDMMLEQGFIAEVQKLYDRPDLHPSLPSMRAVGYRQAWAYLNKEIDYRLMRESAIAATRQLAKRQYTWLRSWENLNILPTADVSLFLDKLQ